MFHQVFPETGLWGPLPRKGLDVFQKAAMREVGREVREERLRGSGTPLRKRQVFRSRPPHHFVVSSLHVW